MSSPMPFHSRMRPSRRAFHLLPLALALSLSVAAADAPAPLPPSMPAAQPAPLPPVAPLAPDAAQSRELEDARRDLERAAQRLADLHREYGMAAAAAAAADAGRMPAGPAWTPMGQDRPRIGVVLAQDEVRGVRIAAVTPEGPAARAGLRSGDRLLAVGDKTLNDPSPETRERDVRLTLQALESGSPVRLRYERDGKVATATVTPERGERVIVFANDGRVISPSGAPGAAWYPHTGIPRGIEVQTLRRTPPPGHAQSATAGAHGGASASPSQSQVDILRIEPGVSMLQRIEYDCDEDASCLPLPLVDAFRWSGLNLAALDAKLGRYFGAREGVLVLGTGADLDGLEPGDVIRKVDGRSVRTPREVMDTLRGREAGSEVAVDYLRDRKSASARLRVPEAQLAELPPLPPMAPMPPLPPMPPMRPQGAMQPLPPVPPVPPEAAQPPGPALPPPGVVAPLQVD